MKKLKKLELIEAPISEMDQEMMDNILAGWLCTSYGPTAACPGYNCSSYNGDTICAKVGDPKSGNYCKTYYAPGGGSYCAEFVEYVEKN